MVWKNGTPAFTNLKYGAQCWHLRGGALVLKQSAVWAITTTTGSSNQLGDVSQKKSLSSKHFDTVGKLLQSMSQKIHQNGYYFVGSWTHLPQHSLGLACPFPCFQSWTRSYSLHEKRAPPPATSDEHNRTQKETILDPNRQMAPLRLLTGSSLPSTRLL